MKVRYLFLPFGVLSLAACGGGGGGGFPQQDYEVMFSEGQRIFDAQSPQGWTSQAQLRTTGAVRYDGYFLAELYGGASGAEIIVGAMRMDADFDDNGISGAIGSVANSEEERYIGTIDFEGGTINRTDDPNDFYLVEADIEGTLTGPNENDIAVDVEMFANFVGDDAQYVYGELHGNVSDGRDTATIGLSDVVLER